MKFIADNMLGRLARYLRAAGHDVLYYRNIEDSDLVSIAGTEQRIILTRDTQIGQRRVCQNRQPSCIIVISTQYKEQLKQLKQELELPLNPELNRCINCNQLLEKIAKQDFKSRIPSYVFTHHQRFWYCSQCDKLYWRGTHCKSIARVLESIS